MSACRHFGSCGGCTYQDGGDYHALKRAAVVAALARAGVDAVVEETQAVREGTRRRAAFKLARTNTGLEIGFHAARSHQIVDMEECLVLTPALFALVEKLRAALTGVMKEGEKAELHALESETGLDLSIRMERKRTPALTAAMAAAKLPAARILFNGEILLENAAPRVSFDGIAVSPPPMAFLQATVEGEGILRERVLAITDGAKRIADLFSGLGTFSLPLARRAKVHAVEQDAAALATLAAAARIATGLKPVTTEKRDLFKLPLAALELNAYDAVVMDPPRAGAEAQARMLAGSKVKRVAYVSCDAATFSRDARILIDGGYKIGPVMPVDQFLYSNHIELVAGFTR